jgi:hypothetical protein
LTQQLAGSDRQPLKLPMAVNYINQHFK